MGLDTIPSWLQVPPSSFVQAGQQGAETGLGVARLEQEGRQHSGQLAQEAQRQRQQADLESAQLSQHEHLAEMEMQARKEIAQQNRLREDQQRLMENAYHQAEVGLGRDRIDQRNALADAHAREAAATYAEESGLAQHLANGGSMWEGLAKFPRAMGKAAALKAGQPLTNGKVTVRDIPGVGKVVQQEGSNHWELLRNEKDKVLQDHKNGSISLLHPDNTLQVIRPPVASATDEMTGLSGNTPTEKPGIFSRFFGGGGLPSAPAPVQAIAPVAAPAPTGGIPFQEGEVVRSKKDPSKVFIIRNGQRVPLDDAAAAAGASPNLPIPNLGYNSDNEPPDTTTEEQ